MKPKMVLGAGILMVTAAVAAFWWQTARGPGVVWENYSEARLEEALAAGQPVVIDVFADWCLPCHELDRFTYTDPGVARSLEGFVKLKLDASEPDAPGVGEVLDRYGVEGVPTVLFLGPDGTEFRAARIEGFVTPREFRRIVPQR